MKKVETQDGWQENGHAGEDREYLRRLGNAVRLARTRRDMTRKGLAEQSGVSERFLAQLETGSGNASVLVLRKIATALDIPIDALLAMGQQSQSPALMETVAFLKTLDGVSLNSAHTVLKEHFSTVSRERRRERIALIGLRGAGKSTLGAKLAERKTWPFVELDRRVEQASGVPLGTLFEMYGQEGFRRLEYRCLHDLLATTECFVLATGGSIVSDAGIYELLLANCFTVWLRATPEDHMQRVIAQGDLRPMAQRAEAMEDLKRILAERDELYRKADVFLTNPAPICVLDEVDAPLDDANVERFCDLLDRMTEETDTRYLIVTHNAVTMSRMHRLYGVTMIEKGVSRLVSVDLGGAETLLAAE